MAPFSFYWNSSLMTICITCNATSNVIAFMWLEKNVNCITWNKWFIQRLYVALQLIFSQGPFGVGRSQKKKIQIGTRACIKLHQRILTCTEKPQCIHCPCSKISSTQPPNHQIARSAGKPPQRILRCRLPLWRWATHSSTTNCNGDPKIYLRLKLWNLRK